MTLNVWYCNSRAYSHIFKAESSKYPSVSGEAKALGLSLYLPPSSGLCDCQFHTSLRWRSLASPILFYFCRRKLYTGKGVKFKRDSFPTWIEVSGFVYYFFNGKFQLVWAIVWVTGEANSPPLAVSVEMFVPAHPGPVGYWYTTLAVTVGLDVS